MFTMILSFLKSLFSATAAVSKEVTQRDAEENTAPMQANAEAAQIQKDRAQASADVKAPDLTQLKNDVAE